MKVYRTSFCLYFFIRAVFCMAPVMLFASSVQADKIPLKIDIPIPLKKTVTLDTPGLAPVPGTTSEPGENVLFRFLVPVEIKYTEQVSKAILEGNDAEMLVSCDVFSDSNKKNDGEKKRRGSAETYIPFNYSTQATSKKVVVDIIKLFSDADPFDITSYACTLYAYSKSPNPPYHSYWKDLKEYANEKKSTLIVEGKLE